MKNLNWNDFEKSSLIVAIHKTTGKEVLCYYNSVCLCWDFFYADTEIELTHCTTNMNKNLVVKEFVYIKTIAEGRNADDLRGRLETENFKFYPEFNIMLKEAK